MTLDEIEIFARTADAGESLVYHRGYLAADRADLQTGLSKTPEQKRVNLIADLAWAYHSRGVVALTQKRHGPRDYSYIMQRCRRRFAPVLSNDRVTRVLQRAA